MTTIELNRSWKKGKKIGDPGGFGQVFEAEADDGSAAAIKLVPKEPGASRELLFEELSGLPNIIPIIDSGEWEDYYVLVMPRAEESLRKRLNDSGGKLGLDEAVVVLGDVAKALASLDGEVVHRDIKPENILLYEGHWCVSDFGISRYAEAATSADTRKFMMTSAYAAPEQWREERATNATDMYAFGVLGFELTQGHLPFEGPDYREQHLHDAPPEVKECPAAIASLIAECMYKPAPTRPSAANVLARLSASGGSPSSAEKKLQAVQKDVVERQGRAAAAASAKQSREEVREELITVAKRSLVPILNMLHERIVAAAPAVLQSGLGGGAMRLADATLSVASLEAAPEECLASRGFEAPFDVVAFASIAVKRPRDRYDYDGRSHSLWFCDAHDEGNYRWFELAFTISGMRRESSTVNPFAAPPTDKDVGDCFTPVSFTRFSLARQPVPVDQGEEGPFIERWLDWFADAAAGKLEMPKGMPEPTGGRFRTAEERRR